MMVKFWKEHTTLRVGLIAAFFAVGLGMVIGGWRMPKSLAGLGIMAVGLVFLLVALGLYNKPFEDPNKGKSR